MTLRDGQPRAYRPAVGSSPRPRHPAVEENDAADRPVRSRTEAQVSDLPGDKNDENLHIERISLSRRRGMSWGSWDGGITPAGNSPARDWAPVRNSYRTAPGEYRLA